VISSSLVQSLVNSSYDDRDKAVAIDDKYGRLSAFKITVVS